MTYDKDLGRVKGDRGAFVRPNVKNETPPNQTVISWSLDNQVNDSEIEDTTINTVFFVPYVDTEQNPYVLKWRLNDSSDLDGNNIITPPDVTLQRGQPGIPGVNIQVIPEYQNINNHIDRIKEYYDQEKPGENIEEGTIFLILDRNDDGYEDGLNTVAYVYDKESDTITNNEPNYIEDAFIKIEKPIDLTNYYTKDETYSKQEIEVRLGCVYDMQQRIINILDNGIEEFKLDNLDAFEIELGIGDIDIEEINTQEINNE